MIKNISYFSVDVGEEKPRIVVSGLVNDIPIEKMQVRKQLGPVVLKVDSVLQWIVIFPTAKKGIKAIL